MIPARLSVLLCILACCPLMVAAEEAAALVEKENVVEMRLHGQAWQPASLGSALAIADRLRTGEYSRAAVRFTDLSMLRVDELTTIEIAPSRNAGGKATLNQERGGSYFYSRDKAQEIEIRTPAANGALRGTEFELRVAANGATRVSMFDGEVELANAQGSVRVRSGEQAEVEVGRAPRKTAMIEAVNVIQWCLYYPAVLDPDELAGEVGARALDLYRAGDLPAALAASEHAAVGRSAGARVYRAALRLSAGQVEKARAALAGVATTDSRRQALERLIAAVKGLPSPVTAEPRTSSEWLAESYGLQARHDLDGALRAARRATELSPRFGYAWARVAELEFSFGRTMPALKKLEVALDLAPRNAQAHALQGFLFSAENRLGAARREFDAAIALDGALGNAWLGRGLVSIRHGDEAAGRRDLQTAAVLEPNRSILRSYLGKAFSQVGNVAKAGTELARATELDPADPTPWLYTAIERKQENRYNEAIDALEKSATLNDNRRVYRSDFLLDQDRAVRGANLAAIYQNDGLLEQSVREAVRAVNSDYGSAPAHLFLANSYNALRDPNRIQLRYETPWFNELLLSHLLSPVGGGSLSQFVSEQEYSKLLEKDGVGITSIFEYSSDGKVREAASQFGTVGNLSYAIDGEYYYDNGLRPNNSISRFESYATFKLQLGPHDTVFFQAKYQDNESGDVFQLYDPREVGRETSVEVRTPQGGLRKVVTKNVPALSYDFEEKQDPGLLLAGWHHEWSPGNHTILLAGRLANNQTLTQRDGPELFLFRDIGLLVRPNLDLDVSNGTVPRGAALNSYLNRFLGKGGVYTAGTDIFDIDYRASFETYTVELQQIVTTGPNTAILGARVQSGQFDTSIALSDFKNGTRPFDTSLLPSPTVRQHEVVDFERLNLYLYDTWRIAPWLTLTGGVTYESEKYPDNFLTLPINGRQDSIDEVLPKAGAIIQPWSGATMRAAYTESLGGSSFDDDLRLEPSQVGGFLQSYRSLVSESVAGSVAASRFKLSGASFEQRLPTRTYFGVELNSLQQDADRTRGAFDALSAYGVPLAYLPSSTPEKDTYREDRLTVTLNQLAGRDWSLGARYRYTHARYREQLTGLSDSLARGLKNDSILRDNPEDLNRLVALTDRRSESDFHEINLFAIYNHPSGFFARAEANWYRQSNDRDVRNVEVPVTTDPDKLRARIRTQHLGLPGDDLWQFNVVTGIRFYRNRGEVSVGLLNLSGADYRFDPLISYAELPRDRTLMVRCKLDF